MAKKEKKLDLFGGLLPAMDTQNVEFYEGLEDDAKKEFAPLIAMRYMSVASGKQSGYGKNAKLVDDEATIHHILATNALVNVGFWELSKFPDLQYKLLAYCGTGTKKKHKWVANSPKGSRAAEIISDLFPTAKDDELELLVQLNTFDDFVEIAKMQGLQDDELKAFKTKLKKELKGK